MALLDSLNNWMGIRPLPIILLSDALNVKSNSP